MSKSIQNSDNRIVHLLIAVLVVATLILYHLFKTTLFEGPTLRAQAENHAIKKVEIEAERGNIFSADKKLLATSMPIYDLSMDPTSPSDEAFNEGIDELCAGLAKYLPSRNALEWKNHIQSNRDKGDRYINLQRKVTFSELQAIKQLPIFNLGKYRGGLIYERRNFRKMPLDQIAQRTIGYDKQTNQAGIEGAYSSYLEGENGQQWKQKITKGQWKPIESGYEKEPKNGYDITTTIDTRIQDVAHDELLKTLEHFEADHGCVIVMEVATGKIKAIANLGLTESGAYREIRNYAVWESTEPGSTFKLASLMVAMEDGYVDTADIVDTKDGIYTIYGKKVKDSNVKYGRKGGYGKIAIAEAFRKSSNTGIVKAVYPHYKDNPEDFVDQLYKIGLHKKLGLEIKGEGSPIIPTPEDRGWNGLTLPWMAFGYSVSLTPLQTLTFYNAVAN
ncbi:MAG: penicillin-binding transpeptidase domain-containing protein, partial [Schleiferiaceae bacterium]|nr:penicillin-binding transpeptidase domain-containing protein [Schleiferiaceae bacterium]